MVSWKELGLLPEPELARYDIAVKNLLCAEGLPGWKKIDIPACTKLIDTWTEKVRWHTLRNMKRFERQPWEFHHSQAYFRALVLITVLQRDCGVRYNPEKIPLDVPFTPEDTFIHGITQGNGGTCATMPVVYCAVGRRLGYPLKLVEAFGDKGSHLFVRWDQLLGERLNLEATAQGLSCHPDEYYRTGMYEKTKKYEKAGCLLQSQTPREELAGFLAQRGWCWIDLKDYRHAAEAFGWAYGIAPHNKCLLHYLEDTANQWRETLEPIWPKPFPKLNLHIATPRYPMGMPIRIQADMMHLEVMDHLLKDQNLVRQWWGPMLRGEPMFRKMDSIDVTHKNGHWNVNFHTSEIPYKYPKEPWSTIHV